MMLLIYEQNYKYFVIGRFIGWLYKGYWLFVSISFLAYADHTLAVWGFPETPQIIVIALLVSVSLYANLSKAETAINLAVILVPLIFLVFVFLQFAWADLIWTNLFPVGESTSSEWAKGLLRAQSAFIGIELYLFLRKHVDSKHKIKGFPLFVYQLLWLSFFLSSVLLTLLFYTLPGLKIIPEPLLYLLKSQEVTFAERLDLFFLYIWMMWIVITVSIISFLALYVHRLHYREHHKRDTIIWHGLLLFLPVFFATKQGIDKLNELIIYVFLVFGIIIPFIVVVTNRRKQK